MVTLQIVTVLIGLLIIIIGLVKRDLEGFIIHDDFFIGFPRLLCVISTAFIIILNAIKYLP